MRLLSLFLAVLIVLTGCSQPEPIEETLPPEPSTTAPTETEPPVTEPVDPLESLLVMMPLEYKIGQLFLARCPAKNALEDVEQYHLGGYVLFGRDLDGQTADTLRETITSYQLASPIPMLIAVDEEGGTVCRVSGNPAFRADKFASPRNLYAYGSMDAVLDTETEKALLLKSLYINVNLSPVCDITTSPGAFMYHRSLGQSPEITGQFVAGAAAIMAENQIGSVLKHFPGYGNNADTHTGIAVDNRSLADLEAADLVPFQMGVDSGCGAIMVSHTIVTAMDESAPASLSPAVHAYLRETMGFDGVIVTDDLAMGAITETYGAGEAAVLAVLAGNDLLISTEYTVQFQALHAAVENGRISEELLDKAVMRVLRWKQKIGLLY